MRAARRRGFTMVEISVFGAVGLLVMTAAWTFFSSSIRKGKSTDVKAEGLQTNLLLARALERDLAALYEDGAHTLRFRKVPGETATLRFFRYRRESPEGAWDPVPLIEVSYTFDARTKRVTRQLEGGAPQVLYGYVERFNVRFPKPVLPTDGLPLPVAPAVIFSSVSTPPEGLRKPLEERDMRSRTTLFGSGLRERSAKRIAYPYWNEIPWRPPPAN